MFMYFNKSFANNNNNKPIKQIRVECKNPI